MTQSFRLVEGQQDSLKSGWRPAVQWGISLLMGVLFWLVECHMITASVHMPKDYNLCICIHLITYTVYLHIICYCTTCGTIYSNCNSTLSTDSYVLHKHTRLHAAQAPTTWHLYCTPCHSHCHSYIAPVLYTMPLPLPLPHGTCTVHHATHTATPTWHLYCTPCHSHCHSHIAPVLYTMPLPLPLPHGTCTVHHATPTATPTAPHSFTYTGALIVPVLAGVDLCSTR